MRAAHCDNRGSGGDSYHNGGNDAADANEDDAVGPCEHLKDDIGNLRQWQKVDQQVQTQDNAV